MKEIKHGTVYQIPLLDCIGGYGYIRIIRSDILFDKPDGYFTVGAKFAQMLKIRSSKPIKSCQEFDIDTVQLFCNPHHLFASVPTRGKDKWTMVGVIDNIPNWDYAPAYNQDLRLWALIDSREDKEHRIVFDELNTKQSFAYLPPESVMHLSTSTRMNHTTARQILNYFWTVENKIPFEEICKSMGYTLKNVEDIGGLGENWLFANYYHPLFPKIPMLYKGKPLPKNDSIDNYINIKDYA
jgi:hypothetical protein